MTSRTAPPALLLILAAARPALAASPRFEFRPNDVVAFLGDSIAAQHLYTNDIEAFLLARYPRLNLRFHNAAVGGSTIADVLKRFDRDVTAWKATVVFVHLGVNDKVHIGPDEYAEQLGVLIDRIRAVKARPVLLTVSPLNDGSDPARLTGENAQLDRFAAALIAVAKRRQVAYVDQFHELLGLWRRNRLSASPIALEGDLIHIGPPGQLTMAYAILKGLGIPRLVSSAEIDASDQSVRTKNCAISDLKIDGNGLSFSRLDDGAAMPVPADAAPGLKLVPMISTLNRYELIINGLAAGNYSIAIDGRHAATLAASALSKGWNIAESGDFVAGRKSLLALMERKRAARTAWREAATFPAPSWLGPLRDRVERARRQELDRLRRKIDATNAELLCAAQPARHRFVIERRPEGR